jgi:hypothetical protein
MHIVVIHRWKEETAELVQALAVAVGKTAYEMRQRMIGGGPAVIASFADPQQAGTLAMKLNRSGVMTLIIDSDALRSKGGRFFVCRFELKDRSLHIESSDGQSAEIAYGDIDLLLSGTRILGQTETITVTERKFSLGKTILSGGIPLSKKVEHQEEVNTEERENILCVYAGERPPIVLSQSGLSYDGLGAAMKLSRMLNFAFLKSELLRLCPAAGYDDRLLTRIGQVRVLGPALNPESSLDLAFDILARSLRCGRIAG